MHVLNAHEIEPCPPVCWGNLTMAGTRMPPCVAWHLNKREGAVAACAHSGPIHVNLAHVVVRVGSGSHGAEKN